MSQLNATLAEKINVTDDLIIIRVKPDAEIADFKPGQYLAMGLSLPDAEGKEKMVRKAYSIGSSPLVKDYLEFYIAIVKDGALTPCLAKLSVGDRLHVAPKIVGDFTLDAVPQGSNAIFVSTGTGLAPFISMIKTPSTWDKLNKVTVLHGVRFKNDLAYRQELLELQAMNNRFSYFPFTSRDEAEENIRKGYVQSVFKSGEVKLNPETDHVYLCGNPAMVEELETYLKENGFKEHTRKEHGNLHMEKYW